MLVSVVRVRVLVLVLDGQSVLFLCAPRLYNVKQTCAQFMLS